MTGTVAFAVGLLVVVSGPVDAQQRVDLPGRDVLLQTRPAPVWSVGTDEGESWEMLSNVGAMAFGRSDQLFVLDQGNHRVLVFDAAGKFVRQFGKQGGGPGEFQAPMGLAVLQDGRVAVLDAAKRAYAMFTPAGAYQGDVFIPEELGFPRPGEAYALPDGSIMARSMPVLRMGAGGGPPDLSSPQKSPVYRLAMSEKPAATTVHEFTMEPPAVSTTRASGGRQMAMAMFSPPVFEKQPSFAALPDGGAAISEEAGYTIDIKNAAGRVVRTLSRPIQPRKVTSKDMELARVERRRQMEQGPRGGGVLVTRGGGAVRAGSMEMSEAQIQEQLRNLTFADEMAVIERVWSDPTGRLWVQRSAREAGAAKPIDLIARGDRYIGTIQDLALPAAVSPSGLAAWIERDAMDIERIVVRRLPAEWK